MKKAVNQLTKLMIALISRAQRWIWHLAGNEPAGCRGVIGPIPQPLFMRIIFIFNS